MTHPSIADQMIAVDLKRAKVAMQEVVNQLETAVRAAWRAQDVAESSEQVSRTEVHALHDTLETILSDLHDHGTESKLNDMLEKLTCAGEISQAEKERRARVVHGWAFRYPAGDPMVDAIREYLAGGPVPKGYEKLDSTVK